MRGAPFLLVLALLAGCTSGPSSGVAAPPEGTWRGEYHGNFTWIDGGEERVDYAVKFIYREGEITFYVPGSGKADATGGVLSAQTLNSYGQRCVWSGSLAEGAASGAYECDPTGSQRDGERGLWSAAWTDPCDVEIC